MNKINKSIIELLPIILGLILIIFLRTELEIFTIVFLIILLSFKLKYHQGEIYLFLFGFIIGIILEFFGNMLLGQRWAEASFFSIPIWLPFAWGYGFIIIRRIGNIVVK